MNGRRKAPTLRPGLDPSRYEGFLTDEGGTSHRLAETATVAVNSSRQPDGRNTTESNR